MSRRPGPGVLVAVGITAMVLAAGASIVLVSGGSGTQPARAGGLGAGGPVASAPADPDANTAAHPSATATASTSTRPSPRATKPAKTTPASAPTGGRPGADNTGVPAGTKLKRRDGDLTITVDGTVIDGLDIHGFVSVKANDVTIRRSIIRGGKNTGRGTALLSATGDHRNLVIEDSTIVADFPSPYFNGINGRNLTGRRLDISNVVDNVMIFGDNASIVDSWLHGNTHFEDDPFHDDGSHDDNIQIEGGTSILVRNNTMEGAFNAAIMITQNYSRTSGVRVIGNAISGGGCSINLSEKGKGPILDMLVQDNVFGPSRLDRCAVIAAASSAPTMRNNTYRDGTVVTVRRGG